MAIALIILDDSTNINACLGNTTMAIKTIHIANVIVALTIIACAATMLNAQSGRRSQKGYPTPATPTPSPEPAKTPTPRPKPDFILKVLADTPRTGSYAFTSPEKFHVWTVERLRRTTLLDVRDSGQANRRDAIKQAKAETEAFVVLLELQSDAFAPMGSTSVRNMTVVVNVYAPVTAKVRFSRTFTIRQNSTRLPGSTTVSEACNPGVYGNDLLLLDASVEAADSIMNSFSVPLPPLCRGIGV